MGLNSFTVTEEKGRFKCQSHNLDDCIGFGRTELDARNDMVRKLEYVRDNDPVRWSSMLKKQRKDLIAKGEVPLIVYNGKV